jgi:hypothetical protein
MTLNGRANKAVVLADKRSAPAKMRQRVKWPSALSALWFRRGPERGQRKRGRVWLVWSLFRGHAIGYERCHGLGELHVQRPAVVDGLDDTIVNLGNLRHCSNLILPTGMI